MKMQCPQCQHVFENALDCPDCRVRLVPSTERDPGRGALSGFAGSDAHRWGDRLQQVESGQQPRQQGGGLVLVLIGAVLLAALAGLAIAFLKR